MKITEKVRSFEDACKVLDITPNIPDLSAIPQNLQKSVLADYKLKVIAQALNEGWIPDWSNGKWDKYFPWFDFDDSSSAGRFSFDDSAHQRSLSNVGSRLCYKSQELSDYAGTQFESLYRDCFVIE